MNGPITQKPTMTRIILTDYLATLPAMMLSFAWGLFLLNEYTGFTSAKTMAPIINQQMPLFLLIACFFTVFDLPLLVWRVRFIQSIFERGTEVSGKVNHSEFFIMKGRIGYEYEFEDKVINSGNLVRRSSRAKRYTERDVVSLIVDPRFPQRAFIKDLYLAM